MINNKIFIKKSFYLPFFENGEIPNVYKSLSLSFNKKDIPLLKKKTVSLNKIHCVHFFPSYINSEIHNSLICRKKHQTFGFAINLNGYTSAEQYLKSQFSKRSQKTFKRSLNRLEFCLNISYKTFYGHIVEEDYSFLMKSLYQMIEKRFQRLGKKHAQLENWKYYLNLFFPLINSKKASIFVVYNNKEPIAISLNYHYDSILFSYITSHKTDYSKFSLGNIENYKQIEWCVANNIQLFDTGYGDYQYKRKWSNFIYSFESHVISTQKNKLAIIYSVLLEYKFKFKNYLISKNIDIIYNKIKNNLKGENKQKKETLEYYTEIVQDKINYKLKNVILDKNEDLSFLNEPLYNFLYTYKEHINNISVYAIVNNQKTFIFKGKASTVKITFK